MSTYSVYIVYLNSVWTFNREEDPTPDDSRITPAHNDNASTTVPGLQNDAYHDGDQVQVLEPPPSVKSWTWKVEDTDAPKS